MKKYILLLLLAFGLVACSNDKKTEKEVAEDTEQEETVVEETEEQETEEIVEVEEVTERTVYVSPEWVKAVTDGEVAGYEEVVILEAAWGEEGESPLKEKGFIPNSIHVNIETVVGEPLWNLNPYEEIKDSLLEMGIDKDTKVILYGSDPSGVARVAYAYLVTGVEDVKVMDGYIDSWIGKGFPAEKETVKAAEGKTDFGVEVPAKPQYWLSMEEAREKLEKDDNFKLVAIRSYEEFIGETSGYSYY